MTVGAHGAHFSLSNRTRLGPFTVGSRPTHETGELAPVGQRNVSSLATYTELRRLPGTAQSVAIVSGSQRSAGRCIGLLCRCTRARQTVRNRQHNAGHSGGTEATRNEAGECPGASEVRRQPAATPRLPAQTDDRENGDRRRHSNQSPLNSISCRCAAGATQRLIAARAYPRAAGRKCHRLGSRTPGRASRARWRSATSTPQRRREL